MFTYGAKNYLPIEPVWPVFAPVFVNDCRYAESGILFLESPGSTGVILMLRGWG